MPILKEGVKDGLWDLWRGRWKYSDEQTGDMIERAMMYGRCAVLDGVLYSANVLTEDLRGKPKTALLTSVNIGSQVVIDAKEKELDQAFISRIGLADMQVRPYYKLREKALATINSIMTKLKTPITFNSTNDLTVTPLVIKDSVDADFLSVKGDYNLSTIVFPTGAPLTEVVQSYHDVESILLKKMGIPATFLSRSSGMGESEVDDASAIDNIVRDRELAIRQEICEVLSITVEWAIKEVVDNGTNNTNPINS